MPISYRLSTTRWPLVVFTYKGLLREDELPQLLGDAAGLFERKEAFVMIHDSREADPSPRKQRYVVSDWIRDHDKALRDNCLGAVIILESLAVRLVLQFIFMISPLPNETYVCRTMEEAERWSATCFKRHGRDENGHLVRQSA